MGLPMMEREFLSCEAVNGPTSKRFQAGQINR